jgi:hypothetical protein
MTCPNPVSSVDVRSSSRVSDLSQKSIANTNDDHTPLKQTSLRAGLLKYEITDRSALGDGDSSTDHYTDLWSAAYREAVDSFGKGIDVAILKGSSAAQLLEKLEDVDKEATQESVFLRGVAYLRSIQVPLERFKLALDLASPLGSLDPTASTVLGVVRSVTAVSLFQPAIMSMDMRISPLLTLLNIDCYKLCNGRSGICKADRRNAGADFLHRRL